MIDLFFSYSHADEELRDELEKHLSTLKRQGIIRTWHDRRIQAGHVIDAEISEHLEKAHIILLLISPDFLASDYCYDREMTRAMERHRKGEARVIPVILRTCDWHETPFGKLMATPTDGKPIKKYADLDDAFLIVVQSIKQAAKSIRPVETIQHEMPVVVNMGGGRNLPRSSNLRVSKQFSDHDRDSFKDETFNYIANFFEGSLDELHLRNPEITFRFQRVDANTFTATVYRDGKKLNECKIWTGDKSLFSNGILYSHGNSMGNSFNESLSVESDNHILFLKPIGISGAGDRDAKLTMEGAAELYWELLIEPLQRD